MTTECLALVYVLVDRSTCIIIIDNVFIIHVYYAGFPSPPAISQVTTGISSVILTVELYAGNPSVLILNITAINQTGPNVTFGRILQSVATQNLTDFIVEIPLAPGMYRFTVHASNLFGNTVTSKLFPPLGIDGIEGS